MLVREVLDKGVESGLTPPMTTLSGPARRTDPTGTRGLVELSANQPRRFYRGGARIADFRGEPDGDGWRPEDWLASATPLAGETTSGLTRLPDGVLLRDAVRADPDGWLGAERVAGVDEPALLVKLLDSGERLPVHCHPGDTFAASRLDAAHGKTEAWVILEAEPGATVHLGLHSPLGADEVAALVRRQDRAELVGALLPVPVEAGDTVLVPAGLPHSIGAGLLILELQQPSDLSVLLERSGFPGAGAGDLGLGDDALGCVDRSGWDLGRVAGLRGRVESPAMLPTAAEPFFRVDRIETVDPVELDPAFAVLVVVGGQGRIEATAPADRPAGTEPGLPVRRGSAVLTPYAVGSLRLSGAGGPVEVLRCRPPSPTLVAEAPDRRTA
jgi:mannose-6-phosphate isomerase